MAAGIFNKLLRDHNIHDVVGESAGVYASDGMHASPEAAKIAREHDIDLYRHRSRALTDEIVEGADLVLTMTGRHWYDVTEFAPRNKVRLLSNLADNGVGDDIPDPFGGSIHEYRDVFTQLQATITAHFRTILDLLDRTAEEHS